MYGGKNITIRFQVRGNLHFEYALENIQYEWLENRL